MDIDMHNAIADKLEASKSAGWLTEYLVAWHGQSGHLSPNVIVWRTLDRDDDLVKAYVCGVLSELVPASDIEIAAN
jgi:hypothetical protein